MQPTTSHLRDAEAAHTLAARRMTVAQKLEAIHTLQQMAWDLKAAWVRRRNPALSDNDVDNQVRNIFLRAAS